MVDCVPYQVPQMPRPLYQMNPGGAPANVACVMAKLGHSSGFIGRVGKDVFGAECTSFLAEAGVDTSYLLTAADAPTTLAFVCLDKSGNRSFSFYRNGSADIGLCREHLDDMDFPASRIFHFGSVSLSAQPARGATLYGVKKAREAGSVISYDPNFRPPLWEDFEEAKREILEAMSLADIIKLSEEEGEFLLDEKDPAKICRRVEDAFNTSMVMVTRAANGCTCSINGKLWNAQAYDVDTIDTTGAGDCFVGGMLHCLIQNGKHPGELSEEEISYMLDFGNATGSLATTKKGAIPAIPTIAEIKICMNEIPRM